MAAEVVEEDAQLAPVDDVEGNVVEVRRAHADDRHLMMLGMHVQPDARLAELVGHVHAHHVGVERRRLGQVRREDVHVAEAARVHAEGRCVAASGIGPELDRGALAKGQQLQAAARGIGKPQRAVGLAGVAHVAGVKVLGGLLDRTVGGELPRAVIMIGLGVLHELETVVLGVGAQQRAARLLRDNLEAELHRPAGGGLIEIQHAKTRVVQVMQADAHLIPPRRRRAARLRPRESRARRAACSRTSRAGRPDRSGPRSNRPPCYAARGSLRSRPR